jgi:hypothetical protein
MTVDVEDILGMPPEDNRTVKVMGQSVTLDPDNMKFNENTLSSYLEKEYAWLDYFGKKLEDANRVVADRQSEFEQLYAACYEKNKDVGCTDKQSDYRAKCDPAVVAKKKELIEAEHVAALIARHLKVWDKNHDNAISRGHFLRKELDRLNRDIKHTDYSSDIIG